jgi:hypothetical protein
MEEALGIGSGLEFQRQVSLYQGWHIKGETCVDIIFRLGSESLMVVAIEGCVVYEFSKT